MNKKLKIAILGSGNIGTDLLVKALRSDWLEATLFVGRNLTSPGMKKASSLGVRISDQSIEAIRQNPELSELVFDCTSAEYHRAHAPILRELGIVALDMTPSQIGRMCVPAINLDEAVSDMNGAPNINMITCGGQASIPIAHTISKNVDGLDYIEVVSSISSRSAGPGTRANIDEYIENTEKGLAHFTQCQNVKAIINMNPAQPCIDMQTTVYAHAKSVDLERLQRAMKELEQRIRRYVPGYDIFVPPTQIGERIVTMVRVRGLGDYLPPYAGNLDIINCAAIAVAEAVAQKRGK